jgi:hypothetical protein
MAAQIQLDPFQHPANAQEYVLLSYAAAKWFSGEGALWGAAAQE